MSNTLEYFKSRGVKICFSLPDGWRINRDATTAPSGYVWINNGKDFFSLAYRHALLYTGND